MEYEPKLDQYRQSLSFDDLRPRYAQDIWGILAQQRGMLADFMKSGGRNIHANNFTLNQEVKSSGTAGAQAKANAAMRANSKGYTEKWGGHRQLPQIKSGSYDPSVANPFLQERFEDGGPITSNRAQFRRIGGK